MKKLLLLLFFVTTIAIAGIPLSTNFTVNTALPIDDRMSVADTTARDAIPALKRWQGMLVYSVADGKHYTLIGGITNGDWSELSGGGNLIAWITANPYEIGDTVIQSNRIYVCTTNHTSGTFATDLSLNYWVELSAGVELTGNQTIAGNKTFSDVTLLGYPAGEPTGVNVNGTTNESSLIVSDVASTKEAQTILHRHSTTLEPLILSARSNSDADIEGDVVANQNMFSLLGTGWKTDNYKVFGSMNIAASTLGTLSSTSAPGKVLINTTPNGATVPTAHLTLESDKSSTFEGDIIAKGNLTAANFQNQNLLVNPSFESSEADDYAWSTSGATVSTSTPSVDGRALQLSLSGLLDINQEIGTGAAAFEGVQMLASVYVKTTLQDVYVCALTNAIESDCTKVAGSGKFEQVIIPFIGNATSNGIKVKTTSSTSGTVYIDNAFVGTSAPFQTISGSRYLGKLKYNQALNCEWTSTATTYSNFTADTDCSTPSVTGIIKAPATKIPAVVLPAGSQAGTYYFVANGMFYRANTSNAPTSFRFSDGTNFSNGSYHYLNSSSQGAISGTVEIPSNLTVDTTYNIQVNSGNGAVISIFGSTNLPLNSPDGLEIQVYYYPPESKIYSQRQDTFEAIEGDASTFGSTDTTVANFTLTKNTNAGLLSVSSTAANGTKITALKNLELKISATGQATNTRTRISITKNSTTLTSITPDGLIAQSGFDVSLGTTGALNASASMSLSAGDIIRVHGNTNLSTIKLTATATETNPTIIGSFAGIEKCANDYECTDMFSATITNGNAISNQNIPWLSTAVWSPAGTLTLTFSTNLKDGVNPLLSNMNCWAIPSTQGQRMSVNTISTTQVIFENRANDGTSNSTPTLAYVYCQKGTNDYKPKTAKVASSIGIPTVPGITTLGTGNLIDVFSVSFGATISTNCASANGVVCPYISSIGGASVNHGASSGTYTLITPQSKTYAKLMCTLSAQTSGTAVHATGSVPPSCTNCASLALELRTSAGALSDAFGTISCIGSY